MKAIKSSLEKISTHEPHSKEYFGEQRNYWWNEDFLNLMSKRWNLQKKQNVLDVGCGIGHWTRLIQMFLSPNAKIVGVDREEEWIVKATEISQKSCSPTEIYFQRADAKKLPFKDEHFDLVTCQTFLIHVEDPKFILSEMLRVLKPGGLLVAVEPNNLARRLILGTLRLHQSIEETLAVTKFQLICEQGKKSLNLGDNTIGDILPLYFAELGLENICTYLSDKAFTFAPPYSTQMESEFLNQAHEWLQREFWIWSKEETMNYFIAGGGKKNQFKFYWDIAMQSEKNVERLISQQKYGTGGGSVTYLISGKKSKNFKQL